MDSHGRRGKYSKPFGHGGKPVPPPIKVNSFADQGAICPVANTHDWTHRGNNLATERIWFVHCKEEDWAWMFEGKLWLTTYSVSGALGSRPQTASMVRPFAKRAAWGAGGIVSGSQVQTEKSPRLFRPPEDLFSVIFIGYDGCQG